MSNDTTRRNAEKSRRGDRVVELEVEREPVGAPVDEDAAAFLQEAAEAAASAALEAEALAAELDDGELVAEATEEAAERAAMSPADVEGASGEASASSDEKAALDATESEMPLDPAEAGAALVEAAGEELPSEAPDAPFDEEEAAAAVASGEELPNEVLDGPAFDAVEAAAAEALEQATRLAADAVEDAQAAAFAAADEAGDAAAQAELARELSEEAHTAEEEALAQAEEERDPDAELAPAEIAELDEEAAGSFEKFAAKARRLSEDQARHVVHSLLFVSDKPLAVEQIRAATGLEPARIRTSLERLAGDLREGISGVVLSEVAGGWQLRTAPESAEFVRRFLQVKPRRLTRAALETLAIIAYRQPVTRPEIEDIRGVDCGAVVKALLDWKLIKILGKKDEVGRPLLYGTSREFLEFFQLKDLASLPTLREFHELNEESQQIVEEELGPEAAAGIAGTLAELNDPAYLEAEKERVAKSEQALAELEQALADAEQKASDVANTINPPKPQPEPEPAAEVPPAE